MSVNANTLSIGNVIRYNNGNWKVTGKGIVKPGKGGAFAQIDLRHLTDGTKTKVRFRTDESVETVRTEEMKMQFLYAEGNDLVVINTDTFEQMSVPKSFLGKMADLLRPEIDENTFVNVVIADDIVIDVKLPLSMIVEVCETEPVIKHSTLTPQTKPCFITPSKSVSINIPSFIEEGARIKINTETMEYVSKA